MPISFSQIPANLKIPLYWVEVDPSKAGLPTIKLPALLVGTMLTVGDAVPEKAIAVGTQAQADAHFGMGSELARMFKAFFANNFANEVWGLGLSEPVGGTAASGTIVIVSPAYQAGTIHLYISGQHIPCNVYYTDTKAQIASKLAAAINDPDFDDLPVIATVGTGAPPATETITLTCKTIGVGGNDIRVELNYFGSIGGEELPPGLDITLPQASAKTATGTGTSTGNTLLTVASSTGTIVTGAVVTGTGVPANTKIVGQNSGTPGLAGVYVTNQVTTLAGVSLTFTGPTPAPNFLYGGVGAPFMQDAIANLGEQQFEYVAMPFTDSNSLLDWEQEYGFSDTGRWGWRRQLYGHIFSARRGTYSDLIVFGATRNSGVVSIMAFEMSVPSPVYEACAAYTAKAQRALVNDPARPLQTLSLNQIKLAPLHDRFNTIELNALATTGLATQKPGSDGQPMISRETTTYQLNLYGQGDDAYELVTTLATLAKLIRNQRHAITTKFPRHKLANDGTRFGPGQAIVTPGIIKAELIAQYRQDEFNGLVEDTRNFKRFLLVERDPNDPNRLNVLYPPDLINQLRIFAVLAQFRLQYDRGIDVEIIGQSGLTGIQPGFTGRVG
jgi:phage tail sheath gpL-like